MVKVNKLAVKLRDNLIELKRIEEFRRENWHLDIGDKEYDQILAREMKVVKMTQKIIKLMKNSKLDFRGDMRVQLNSEEVKKFYIVLSELEKYVGTDDKQKSLWSAFRLTSLNKHSPEYSQILGQRVSGFMNGVRTLFKGLVVLGLISFGVANPVFSDEFDGFDNMEEQGFGGITFEKEESEAPTDTSKPASTTDGKNVVKRKVTRGVSQAEIDNRLKKFYSDLDKARAGEEGISGAIITNKMKNASTFDMERAIKNQFMMYFTQGKFLGGEFEFFSEEELRVVIREIGFNRDNYQAKTSNVLNQFYSKGITAPSKVKTGFLYLAGISK